MTLERDVKLEPIDMATIHALCFAQQLSRGVEWAIASGLAEGAATPSLAGGAIRAAREVERDVLERLRWWDE